MHELIQEAHKGQVRNGNNTPYWHHCVSVAEILYEALIQDKVIKSDVKEDFLLAAMGHDLYEDTEITRDFIKEDFGERVDSLIFELTNEQDDYHRNEYLKKLSEASEGAKLIKMADFIDNTSSIIENINSFETVWIKEFFSPIQKDIFKVISRYVFVRYERSGKYLAAKAQVVNQKFINEIGC